MAPPLPYDPEVGDRICDLIADGKSLREVCRTNDDLPSRVTIYKWLRTDEGFANQYARACEDRAEAHFEEILEIADDARNDWMERNGEEDAGWQANGEHIQRSRLRVDARRWALSKMNPKKYGDKLDMNHSGGVTVVLESDADKL